MISLHDQTVSHSAGCGRCCKDEGIFAGSAWMVPLSMALFFLPLINGLVGGFVGRYKVGSVERALLAAILRAALVAASPYEPNTRSGVLTGSTFTAAAPRDDRAR